MAHGLSLPPGSAYSRSGTVWCITPSRQGGNPRFAGMDEIRQVAFERGQPWFPGDFPGTAAGAEWELEERRKRKAAWERRPKSKRVAWESLDLGGGRKGEIGDGFASNFELLFKSTKARRSSNNQNEDPMDIDQDESTQKSTQQKSSGLHGLQQISKDSFKQLLEIPRPTTIPANALVTVRITLLSRGIVTPCARIYRLPPPPTIIPPSSEAEVPATIPPGVLVTFFSPVRYPFPMARPRSVLYDTQEQGLQVVKAS
ncbi:Ribonucleases P/MRP protein subunit pop1 [Fusarium solani]